VALAPLIAALTRSATAPPRARRAFGLGLTAGAVYFAGTLYWLVETMTTFGGLPVPVAVFAAALLVAYLSLFPAAFAVVVDRFRASFGPTFAVLSAAPVWMASELGRQYVWDGFPWALLGYSQVGVLPIAQLASLAGVYALSGLLALASAGIVLLTLTRGRRGLLIVAAIACAIGGVAWWGSARIAGGSLTSAGDVVRVAVVQGNIAQDDKWNPRLSDAIIRRYITMTRTAIERGAKFIIWPESSLPVYFEEDLARSSALRQLARDAGVTLLIGSDQIERTRPGAFMDDASNRRYNAAFLVKPDGTTGAVYRKVQLVPFGEYVPLQKLLFFVAPIVEGVGHFTPGQGPVMLPLGDHAVSTAICYEVIYGSLIRRFVNDGSELLTTITNDAWYGWSSAAYQHWDQAAMRSIENGRYLARAANTGVSGFVDPYGRTIEKSVLFEQALLIQDVRLLRTRTLYSRIGDLAAWLALAFTGGGLLASRRLRLQ
jgi:apolipoprotein N-acyltransferase